MNYHELLTVIASLIAIASSVPYVRDIAKGRTRPNVVTWFTWTLLNGINATVAFSAGAWQTAFFSLCGLIATGVIVVLGLKRGLKHYTKFDAVCQIIALLGIPLWLITRQPELAIIIVILVDFAGGLPTLRHAWRAPNEETLTTYLMSIVAGLLLLISLAELSFVAVAMPLYIVFFDGTIAAVLMLRRRALKPS